SRLRAGVLSEWAANTITISGTPTAAGTFNYTIPLTGGCGHVNATGTITVNPIPTAAITTPAYALQYCQGGTGVTLITQPITGATYEWFNGGVSQGATSGSN